MILSYVQFNESIKRKITHIFACVGCIRKQQLQSKIQFGLFNNLMLIKYSISDIQYCVVGDGGEV